VTALEGLQAAVDAAAPGDVLELTPGATYDGPINIPSEASEICIVTAGFVQNGVRVSPGDAAAMAKISGGTPAVVTTSAGAKAHFVFVEIFSPTFVYNTMDLFDSTGITLERSYLHADPTTCTARRGIAGNGSHVIVQDSYLAGFCEFGADSQAFAMWDGDGPATLRNNYLEAASENVLFGGADPSVTNRVPSDIVVVDNLIEKPMSWRTDGAGPRNVKNCFELKNARRVTVQNNTFKNNWADAQSGFCLVITVRNQDGTCPWCTVQDVLVQNNTLDTVDSCWNILVSDDSQPSVSIDNIRIDSNTCSNMGGLGGDGRTFQIVTGLNPSNGTLAITNNTIAATPNYVATALTGPDNGEVDNFTFTGNDMLFGQYGVIAGGLGVGTSTITTRFPGATFGGPGALTNTFHDPVNHCSGFDFPAGNDCVDP
jgi:hypothetical protein